MTCTVFDQSLAARQIVYIFLTGKSGVGCIERNPCGYGKLVISDNHLNKKGIAVLYKKITLHFDIKPLEEPHSPAPLKRLSTYAHGENPRK